MDRDTKRGQARQEAQELIEQRTEATPVTSPAGTPEGASPESSDALLRKAIESARQATECVIAGVRPAEGNWRSAVAIL